MMIYGLLAADSKWMMENGWKAEIKLNLLLEGLTNWQFEQAEAKTNRFTRQHKLKTKRCVTFCWRI